MRPSSVRGRREEKWWCHAPVRQRFSHPRGGIRAGGDARPAVAGSHGGRVSSELQRALDESVDPGGVPGAIAWLNDGDGRPSTGAAGVADLRTGRPIHPLDRFRIGSVTKPFVATVVLQLVAEGRLSLEDSVGR